MRQLYTCCPEDIKQGLSCTTGGKQCQKIKQLAVRYQNPAVQVQEFLLLSQQPDESVRHYLPRLWGVAGRCYFVQEYGGCQTDVSYEDSVVRFKLIAGLGDPEINYDILSTEDRQART